MDWIKKHSLFPFPFFFLFLSYILEISIASFKEYTWFLQVKASCGWFVLGSHLGTPPIQTPQTHLLNCLLFPPCLCFWEKLDDRMCSSLSGYFSNPGWKCCRPLQQPFPRQTPEWKEPDCFLIAPTKLLDAPDYRSLKVGGRGVMGYMELCGHGAYRLWYLGCEPR